MPMHDWRLIPDGIFHAFHHGWITRITDRLNAGGLPDDFYALPEQDVLALHSNEPDDATSSSTRFISEAELYRRKKSHITIRHVSGDRIVAVLEIVSPGNKSADYPLETFVRKARNFLDQGVHLLILDPLPPGPNDPGGVHAIIWREFSPEPFHLPAGSPLTQVAYEAGTPVRAYVEPMAVGGQLADMPLFIGRGRHVLVPLEETYQAAFAVQPRRWRTVLAAPTV